MPEKLKKLPEEFVDYLDRTVIEIWDLIASRRLRDSGIYDKDIIMRLTELKKKLEEVGI